MQNSLGEEMVMARFVRTRAPPPELLRLGVSDTQLVCEAIVDVVRLHKKLVQ